MGRWAGDGEKKLMDYFTRCRDLQSQRHLSCWSLGGINLGSLTEYLFFFANGSQDANWQGATKGFAGDVAVDGILAKERTSGDVPYAGTIYTNDSTLGAWQDIVNKNPGQASASTGQTALISELKNDLNNAFTQLLLVVIRVKLNSKVGVGLFLSAA